MAKLLEQHTHPKHPRLYVQLRDDSKWLQAVAFVGGQKSQYSTRTQHLLTAYRLAEDWYLRKLRVALGEEKRKDPLDIPIMEALFNAWKLEVPQGSKREWIEMKWSSIARFWEALRVSEISTQTFKEFYRWRRQGKKPPKNSTLHQDVVLIRQILKFAVEEQHIPSIPAIPTVGKIDPNPRPWFTQDELDRLLRFSDNRIHEVQGINPRLHKQRLELDQQIRFMVNTMLRVEEAFPAKPGKTPLRYCDCRVQKNAKKQWVLVCEVKGKRGERTSVGRHEAAKIFDDRKSRASDMTALVFPVHHREAFTELLKEAGLHKDNRGGFERNFKSLRCTAISLAILRGAPSPNLLMIARNAGTSVAMIDAFYARRLSAEMGLDVLTE